MDSSMLNYILSKYLPELKFTVETEEFNQTHKINYDIAYLNTIKIHFSAYELYKPRTVIIKPYRKSHKLAFDEIINFYLSIFPERYVKRYFVWDRRGIFDILGVMNIDEYNNASFWLAETNEIIPVDNFLKHDEYCTKIKEISWFELVFKNELMLIYKITNGHSQKLHINYYILDKRYEIDTKYYIYKYGEKDGLLDLLKEKNTFTEDQMIYLINEFLDQCGFTPEHCLRTIIHNEKRERYYSPGGDGYIEAFKDFTDTSHNDKSCISILDSDSYE